MGYKYIVWNNKEILIKGRTIFFCNCSHYFGNCVNFTKDLLFDMMNTQSCRGMKEQDLLSLPIFWFVGAAVRPKLRVNIPNFKAVNDSGNKCKNYYFHLIKLKYPSVF